MGARGGRGGAPAPARSADADTGRVALVLPDRLAADQPPHPLRARARPLRGVWPAARHAGGPARRRPLVRRGRADLARRRGEAGALAGRGRLRGGEGAAGLARHGTPRPRPAKFQVPQPQGTVPALPLAARPAGGSQAPPPQTPPRPGARAPLPWRLPAALL